MLPMDMPNFPPQYAQVMLTQASQSQQTRSKYERTIGVCQLINNPPNAPKEPWAGSDGLSPAAAVALFFQNIEGRVFSHEVARVSVIEDPKHGMLRATDDGAYYYFPETGYLGSDRAAFLVEIGDRKFKVVHALKMYEIVPESAHEDKKYCPKGIVWKISFDAKGGGSIPSVEYQPPITDVRTFTTGTTTLASTMGASFLSSFTTSTPGVTVNIATLIGGAVAQTTGSNITLDTNAAADG